ncbi:alkaline phosphatase [Kiritimatiellaeota bacterium B1221]|nr:alkaline phosphatase [Kiritimatiellaeota bacterium B1221]
MKAFLICFWIGWGLLQAADPGSVVFLHPDGTGLGHWYAGRLLSAGPDGELNWDRMEKLSVYEGHQSGWLSSSSHAGATAHAYGKKVHPNSYGLDRDQTLTAASGAEQSIMQEAISAGIRCGIVNSGHIGEPGTGVFLASVESRKDVSSIALQIIQSGVEIIFCGGEIYLLPENVMGEHGQKGVRTDGKNLIEDAKAQGYTVIYTREDLLALPADAGKVLGIFAATNTYNDQSEEALKAAGLETYDPAAPTFAEMTAKALELLGSDPAKEFFLVAEEEGTDNFSNVTHAKGMIDAVLRADAAVGEALKYMMDHRERKILTVIAADSDAGRPAVWAPFGLDPESPLPENTDRGAALDGKDGSQTLPFVSAPDAQGLRHAFGIAWPYSFDMQGGVIARASGYRSELMSPLIHNTGIYEMLYQVLWGID